jgi:hypothetical protein
MKRSVIVFSLALVLLVSGVTAFAEDPIAIRDTSASIRAVENGNLEITFLVMMDLRVAPMTFNYHWERSDGAKSEVKVVSIRNEDARTFRITETWTVGRNVPLEQLWEKIFVNTGNTHLVSEPIPARGATEVREPRQGAHPAYLAALSDLRLARALLRGWSNILIDGLVGKAIAEIEGAIGDIREAAISDGKDIDDHPPIDTGLDNRNRLMNALQLLNKSYSDVDQRETNPEDAGLRSKALGHISRAREALNDALRIARWL